MPTAWDRADVYRTGYVEALRVPVIIREIVANPLLGIGLQMQKPKPAALAQETGKPDKIEFLPRKTDVPEHWTGREDDTFMRSIIDKYSVEKFVNDKPTG
jgi:hypothetical protein